MAKEIDNKLFREAKEYIPGGVNSPVRSFKAVGGKPVFIKKGKGSHIYGENGSSYIDYCMSWGALILGHAHPEIVRTLKSTAAGGTSFGALTRLEVEFAKCLTKAVPSVEMVRLTASGTEGAMSALRLARAYTKRDKVIKFDNAYHGHADYFLRGLADLGVPESAGKHTIILPYNDLKAVKKCAKKYGKNIAAIIVEPVAGNCGVVLPKDGFLRGLRKIADRYGIVLIFDEVITGFRLSYGGAQGLFKIKPDLTCFGKIIGGGLPIGAFGGRKEIMKLIAPEGKVYQAGTFSGNPLSVACGKRALDILKRTPPYEKLRKNTETLCKSLEKTAAKYGVKLKMNRIASMFSFSFKDKDKELFKKFFHGMLARGVYLSPSEFEANFFSGAHTAGDIKKTLAAAEDVFKDMIKKGAKDE